MRDAAASATHVTVEFQPSGQRVAAPAGQTLLEVARNAGVGVSSVCGGVGLCDSCRVRIVRGAVSGPTAHEHEVLEASDLQLGYRLACQAKPRGNLVVDVPAESMGTEQRLQLESDLARSEDIVLSDLPVRMLDVGVPPPHLGDLRSDFERLCDACAGQGVAVRAAGRAAIAQLPDALRAFDWTARVTIADGALVATLPEASPAFGLAVDVGTTKLAAYLVDLGSGRTVASEGAINPQVTHGEDVVSRIAYADRSPDGVATLQRVLAQALNEMIGRLCTTAGVSRTAVVDAVLVGNTAMQHLACGFPVAPLGRAPYVAAITSALTLPALDLGLQIAPGARVYLPPSIAGYVGADHVAVLLAVGPPAAGRTRLVIDIGTNTEISLVTSERITCCSCASGPAFEGAHVGCGMRATAGAIERVRVVAGRVCCETVGGKPPIGICGSGVLDAVAQLVSAGAVDRHGGFRRDHPLFTMRGEGPVLLLAAAEATGHGRDVTLTRRDVTEIQLAKAAIRTGIDLLLARAQMASDDVHEILVAGAFGSYLDLASARRIGMLPDLPAGRFRQVGNAAGAGARQLVVSVDRRRAGEMLARRVEYLDLTTVPRFPDTYAAALGFA